MEVYSMITRFAVAGALTAVELTLLKKGKFSTAIVLGAIVISSADAVDRKLLCYCP